MEEILQPIYRIEDFWYAIVNGLSCPHTPIYRIEQYLAYLCGADVEVPQPIYRIEQYLAYKCGLDVELPTPIYRDEMFLAKWCGMDVEPPTPIYRIEVLLSQLSNGELKTVTGNPISISDALAKPAESLVIEILPQQDLHGYANPWPAGGGKQLINPAQFDELPNANNGVTATDNGDGTISLSGTATANAYLTVIGYKTLSEYGFFEPDTSYTFSAYVKGNVYGIFGIYGSGTDYQDSTGVGRQMTFTAEQLSTLRYRLVIYVANGTNTNGMVVKPMICLSTATDPTVFAPYSNLCPITGFTGVNIQRTGKNLLEMPFEYYTATASKDNCFHLPSGTYTFSFDSTTETTWRFVLRLYDAGGNEITIGTPAGVSMPYRPSVHGFSNGVNATNKSFSFTLGSDAYVRVLFWGGSTSVSSSFTNAQIELGSTATAYEPYTGTTYSIDWTDEAGTVYGGELDVTTGVLTVERAMVDFGTLSWGKSSSTSVSGGTVFTIPLARVGNGVKPRERYTPNNVYSDKYATAGTSVWWVNELPDFSVLVGSTVVAVADSRYDTSQAFKSANVGTQFVYELATPLTIQLTPTQVDMLLGNNVIWNDINGDMTLEYLADGPADDVDALNILLGNRYVNNRAEDEATDKEALEILLGGNTR